MRVISGTLKGRNILVPKNFKGRPTTDFGREGLFNVLQHLLNMDGLKVLDLFAGTGAFSIECFSRGASNAVSVEKQPLHVKFIRENYRLFDIQQGQVILADVNKYLASCKDRFDLVFADPPFDMPGLETLPDEVLSKQLVRPGGLLVIEHGRRVNFKDHPLFVQERSYSNVHFSFFAPSQP